LSRNVGEELAFDAVIFQKNADVINIAVETWDHEHNTNLAAQWGIQYVCSSVEMAGGGDKVQSGLYSQKTYV
jgi:hypothetical protein